MLVRRRIRRSTPLGRDLGRRATKCRLQLGHDRLGQLVLELEHVGGPALVLVRPALEAVGGAGELHRDAEPVACAPHRAGDHALHAQRAADLLHRRRLSPVGVGRGASRHPDVGQTGQGVGQLVGHAVGEVLVPGIAARVHEGKDGDGVERSRRGGRRFLSPSREEDDREPGEDRDGARHQRQPRAARRAGPGGQVVEHLEHFGGALRTVGRLLGETAHDQLGQPRRDFGAPAAHRLGHVDGVRADEGDRGARREGRRTGEHLVGHAAEGVDVGAVVGRRVADSLLRRHVRRRPHHHAQRGESALAVAGGRRERLGDAEVGHHAHAAGEEHILRLDVAVHDAVLVRVDQRARHVPEQAHRFGDRHRALAPVVP